MAEIRTLMNAEETARMNAAVHDILCERARQVHKWGIQEHPDLEWNVIFGEEYGEVQRALIDDCFGGKGNLREELIHTAAVATAWIEDIDRRVAELSQLMGLPADSRCDGKCDPCPGTNQGCPSGLRAHDDADWLYFEQEKGEKLLGPACHCLECKCTEPDAVLQFEVTV